jgi:hypothetical protein
MSALPHERSWEIGDRVCIPAVKRPLNQPHPEHEGKEGNITGIEPMSFGSMRIDTPVITLDDGTVLRGYECWWQPVENRKGI